MISSEDSEHKVDYWGLWLEAVLRFFCIPDDLVGFIITRSKFKSRHNDEQNFSQRNLGESLGLQLFREAYLKDKNILIVVGSILLNAVLANLRESHEDLRRACKAVGKSRKNCRLGIRFFVILNVLSFCFGYLSIWSGSLQCLLVNKTPDNLLYDVLDNSKMPTSCYSCVSMSMYLLIASIIPLVFIKQDVMLFCFTVVAIIIVYMVALGHELKDFRQNYEEVVENTMRNTPSESVVAPDNLGDEVETFTKIKNLLKLGENVNEIAIDDRFLLAFQILFRIDFKKVGPDAERTCRGLFDISSNGSIEFLHWHLFYLTWRQSGMSMADYLKPEST